MLAKTKSVNLSKNLTDSITVVVGGIPTINVESLITENMGLVGYAVNACGIKGPLVEDALAEGYLALVEAANKYEPSLGKFSSYAYKCIVGEIKWFLSKNSSILKFPTSIYKMGNKVKKYMQVNNFINVSDLKGEDWDNLGIADNAEKDEVITYIGSVVCMDATIDEDGNTIADIVGADDNFSGMIEDETLNRLYKYIDGEYVHMRDNRKRIAKHIIFKAVTSGVVEQSAIAKEMDTSRQVVFEVFKTLKDDIVLRDILINGIN